jgi:hypothetical protein
VSDVENTGFQQGMKADCHDPTLPTDLFSSLFICYRRKGRHGCSLPCIWRYVDWFQGAGCHG